MLSTDLPGLQASRALAAQPTQNQRPGLLVLFEGLEVMVLVLKRLVMEGR